MFIRTLSTLVFSKLQEEFPASIQFVYSLVKSQQKKRWLSLQTDQQSYSIDQLVLASGHWENDETEEERVWVDYAKKMIYCISFLLILQMSIFRRYRLKKMSFKRSRLKFLIMSDCLQYQEKGASRTKRKTCLSSIRQGTDCIQWIKKGLLITLEEETKSKADQWHGHGY